ncbi:MAG TPA: hypothetical protein VKT78_09100, partial [Fimbriimonadaceae bacterium]|nr:hypothetical protein [Fimbriimonadaceae bacterium]
PGAAQGRSPQALRKHALAVEDLIAGELSDLRRLPGAAMPYGVGEYKNPRICDLAAMVLATKYPTRYRFALGGTLTDLNRQCLECRDTWRRARGLPI